MVGGGVTECRALRLVVSAWSVWEPGPLKRRPRRAPLIEPDQFVETASRLPQLSHQRRSNNCTLWPLRSLAKKEQQHSHICVCFKASMAALKLQ